jgi:hypothetical protein
MVLNRDTFVFWIFDIAENQLYIAITDQFLNR